MGRKSSRDRAARKRAERKKRRQARGGGGGEPSGGGLMTGMRGGFKKAVHGKQEASGKRTLTGWLPILIFIVALVFLIQRLGLF